MRTIYLAWLLLSFGVCIFAKDNYVLLQTEEGSDRPTGFKEGLPSYVSLVDDQQTSLGQFLLCTSCTISYMFGTDVEIERLK